MTHVPCPGCGSTRAVWALARGDLHGMLRHNFLAPLMAVLVAALALDALMSVLRTGSLMQVGEGRYARYLPRAVLVVALLEIVLWGARFAGFLGGPVPV
ncbi:MAG: DUF2752 domain-containing protein [Labilithrix sp.]|nr:DUF2752 domain-containing protein [Labilithrix sp.]